MRHQPSAGCFISVRATSAERGAGWASTAPRGAVAAPPAASSPPVQRGCRVPRRPPNLTNGDGQGVRPAAVPRGVGGRHHGAVAPGRQPVPADLLGDLDGYPPRVCHLAHELGPGRVPRARATLPLAGHAATVLLVAGDALLEPQRD